MPTEKSTSTEFVQSEQTLKCKRCGRKLKNPESMELGFGVICYEKYKKRQKLIPLFTMNIKKEADEMDEKMAKELTQKAEKIKRLETKVKNLKKSNQVKESVIAKLVERLIPDGDDVSTRRTDLIRELMKEVTNPK